MTQSTEKSLMFYILTKQGHDGFSKRTREIKVIKTTFISFGLNGHISRLFPLQFHYSIVRICD